jgi:hypothetical protein
MTRSSKDDPTIFTFNHKKEVTFTFNHKKEVTWPDKVVGYYS